MCCVVVQLNMTGTLSLYEQQSAAIYIHCVSVWVSSGKKATKMSFGFFILSDGQFEKNNLTPNQCQSDLKLNKTFGTKFILTKKYQFDVL